MLYAVRLDTNPTFSENKMECLGSITTVTIQAQPEFIEPILNLIGGHRQDSPEDCSQTRVGICAVSSRS
jgi:hypothetical protein